MEGTKGESEGKEGWIIDDEPGLQIVDEKS